VAKIVRGGLTGSADSLSSSQGNFRAQVSALLDAVRQLIGNPEIGAGSIINDPLNAPYVLYWNPYTGKDTFVGGSYSTAGDATKRIELQRLECGYTPTRPFRTINRAIIEAGIITAKAYYQNPLIDSDLVSIVLAPGAASVLNGAGATSVSEWESGKEPTDSELQAFNPSLNGGILLPRGASIVAMHGDLRKTIIRPSFVPAPADEMFDSSNRRSILKVTGTSFCYGLTFMDKVGTESSHHLLSCFEFAGKAELDEFYAKICQAFGGTNNTGGLDLSLAVAKKGEYEITGPRPTSGSQTIETDTTKSASPYIFNCSIRSNFGLCGIFADGEKPTGFKSMVVAQLTGVSLQRDLENWQKYDSTRSPMWGNYFTGYNDYINSDPNNVRMNPARRSFHIRAINNAIIQEVSVFAIGQGIHHWVQSGGELTVTNSNSNFGGCAALAEGYKNSAFASDTGWNVGSIRVATNLADKTNAVRKIYLGTVAAGVLNSATAIQLAAAIEDSQSNPGVPKILDKLGYTLAADSYIWIENSRGNDYRAQLTASAWSSSAPDTINVASSFENQDGISPGDSIVNSQGYDTGQDYPSLAGARIYVRRLQDVRSVDERRYSLRCNNTNSRARTPLRDYILQTTSGNGGVVSAISEDKLISVAAASAINPDGAGAIKSASVELRRNNPANNWASNGFYRLGDTVRYQNKTYTCTFKNSDSTFNPQNWQESFVHMGEGFKPEDYWKNSQPAIVFDGDTDGNDNSQSCGYDLLTVWSTDDSVKFQYRSASDYRGVHSLLTSLGFSSANAHTILLPRASSSRERNPATALDGIGAPIGAATAWGNWPVEFRRPSNIRLFGHAWEWSGFLNYTKALPEYQLDLTALNKFTYYFTNQNGGRVYGSGFNEEGFLVTPQGLQDLATGNEVTFENIAESNVDIDDIQFPTSYNELTANKVTVSTELDLAGASVIATPASWGDGFGTTLPPIPSASTTGKGIVQMATVADLEDLVREDLAVSPGTLSVLIDEITARLTPVGAVIYVPSSTPPTGWIKANGAVISRVDFADLWTYAQGSGNLATSQASKQLGQFGPGNGTTTFTLPDLRAEFIRGLDDGRGIDAARTLGSSQADAFKSHAHGVNDPGHSHSYQQNQDRNTDHSGTDTVTNNPYFISGQTGIVGTGITIQSSGEVETRPLNVALLAVIKF